ncbi:MAG: SRPBCC domain-containing protein [Salinimicrobium sp.]
MKRKNIELEKRIYAPLHKVWQCWTLPEHIQKWNFANPDWHTPRVQNDFREKGKFSYRMEAKDGSVGFDFEGFYEKIEDEKLISYTISDGRKVKVKFLQEKFCTCVQESFEVEDANSAEAQQAGWQAILDNFKSYVEKEFGAKNRTYSVVS